MRYTVFGAGGFIGRATSDWLRAAGHEVLTPARDAPLPLAEPLGRVIYAIGLTADFRTRPFDTVRAHVGVLADLLEHGEFESLVYLSSTRVYGGAGGDGTRGDEEASLAVRSQDASDLYNLSKLTGESLCLHGGRAGVRVARLSNVIGPGKAGSDDFVPALVRAARAGHVQLRSHPDSAKDYVALADLPPLLERLAGPCRERIYNLASGRQIGHAEWLERLAVRTGCTVDVDADAPLQRFPAISIARVADEFGFVPRDPLGVLDQLFES